MVTNNKLLFGRIGVTIMLVYFVIAAYGDAQSGETVGMLYKIVLAIILFEVRATLLKMHK